LRRTHTKSVKGWRVGGAEVVSSRRVSKEGSMVSREVGVREGMEEVK